MTRSIGDNGIEGDRPVTNIRWRRCSPNKSFFEIRVGQRIQPVREVLIGEREWIDITRSHRKSELHLVGGVHLCCRQRSCPVGGVR